MRTRKHKRDGVTIHVDCCGVDLSPHETSCVSSVVWTERETRERDRRERRERETKVRGCDVRGCDVRGSYVSAFPMPLSISVSNADAGESKCAGRPYYNNPNTQQTVWELPMWPGENCK